MKGTTWGIDGALGVRQSGRVWHLCGWEKSQLEIWRGSFISGFYRSLKKNDDWSLNSQEILLSVLASVGSDEWEFSRSSPAIGQSRYSPGIDFIQCSFFDLELNSHWIISPKSHQKVIETHTLDVTKCDTYYFFCLFSLYCLYYMPLIKPNS